MIRRRILAVGAWDEGAGYPRASALLAALAGAHELDTCRIALPTGGQRAALLRSPWRWPARWLALRRARRHLLRLLATRLLETRPELVFVPYPGHLLVHWVRQVWRGPLLLDLFLSAYDTAVVDRQLFRPGSPVGRWLRRLDRQALAAADVALLDTRCQVQRIAATTGADPSCCDWVPVGFADDEPPAPYEPPPAGATLRLLFFGTGIPLHGLPTLLQAICRVPGVHLTLAGGSREERLRALELPAGSVTRLAGFVGAGELRRQLQQAHLVAGAFGTSAKADSVVPFKVVHALRAGRPVVTGATSAVAELLQPGSDCLVVPPGDPEALAALLRRLRVQPQELAPIAAAGRRTYERRFSTAAIAAHLLPIVERLTERTEPMRSPLATGSPA
jgi:glycosyltransferase involved in cell wall biosynthesis